MPFYTYAPAPAAGQPEPLTGGLMTFGFNVEIDGTLTMTNLPPNAANDAAAAALGVGIGEYYRNGSISMIRAI